MLQQVHRRTTPDAAAPRLARLRAAMAEAGVDAFLVPRADAHQGENVAPRDERLAWLTGFTGSAGFAVVTRDAAAVFVDGRYRLQVRAETDPACFASQSLPDDRLADWLVAALPGGGRVGFDPWLHGAAEIEALAAALEPRQLALARVANLVDAVWDDQPPPPAAPLAVQPDALAGRSAADKRAAIAADLAGRGLAAAVLTLPDSIAWLLNVRGADVARTPVPLAFAVLAADGTVDLLVDPAKLGPEVAAHLGAGVRVRPEAELGAVLDGLTGRVAVDRATAPVWVSDRLRAAGRAEVVWTPDPCALPKATKTPAEIAGTRAAHLRDGAAMARFLAWLDAAAPAGGLTEIDVVRRLEDIRRDTGALRDISFDTISGAGPNGAIVHYRVSEATNRPVRPGELLLVDSGAQYQDGTTDVTRTIAVGAPPPGAAAAFTLVLRGLIAMSRLRWPPGLAGRDIDAIARAPLWAAGLDYDHGTGHGVGSYLGVHEGPAGLSRRSTEPILPGMILSIEPGYYREGAFGIRIENLAVVRPPEIPEGGERPMLGWETLTLAPVDRRLIDPARLDAGERAWLDAYHARVASELAPLVPEDVAPWLRAACAPL
ncbi:aminopeptidase P family protein [Amaricoccus sp.]|uniref:aminopeptidase P family protein n=1 Tax=Amaricoccus sp. TaxID=1872485 RepID=UPI001B675673|nr:aminopeptidase P family protein [Amaricoccus sp.]MBP7000395.1 aminopeptidase P family protein [Amaricoccus sp.]